MKVKVKRLIPEARLPAYAHPGDAGMDLFAAEEKVVEPGEITLVRTGLGLEFPAGYEAQVRPKSGLALKHGVTLLNTPGTIDAGYRGELCVVVINHGKAAYKVERGTKIAQVVFKKVETAQLEEVEALNETARSQGGFGSTGVR